MIAALCREIFNGRNNKAVFEEGRKWIPYISDIFLPIADTDTGDFRRLPFEGDPLDQPYMSLQVIKLIQLNYRLNLKQQTDSKMKAARSRRK